MILIYLEDRFNGVKFLQEMSNKTIMFVGDSLGRNQWESLMCMISASAPHIHTHIIHEDPLSTFKILVSTDTNFCYLSKYLVKVESIKSCNYECRFQLLLPAQPDVVGNSFTHWS